MDIRRLVGLNLVRLRNERGLTQEAFSEISGMTQGYISDVENGRRNPTVMTLHQIAESLDVHASEMLRPVDPEKKSPPG
jgi:transcriptional regulator with XRE-family HTH domain